MTTKQVRGHSSEVHRELPTRSQISETQNCLLPVVFAITTFLLDDNLNFGEIPRVLVVDIVRSEFLQHFSYLIKVLSIVARYDKNVLIHGSWTYIFS